MYDVHHNLLHVLSHALWKKDTNLALSEGEWDILLKEAEKQGVLSFVLQGCTSIRKQVSTVFWRNWRNVVVSTVASNFSLVDTQDQILRAMEEEKIQCAILKGTSVAICYPDPDMRALGDIDLLVKPECQEMAIQVLKRLGYTAPEESFTHPYHVDFYGNGVVVELHYAASTFPENDCGKSAKSIMDGCWDHIIYEVIREHSFPCLGDVHQALSLLMHMERHMTSGCIGLRQLCDWAVFMSTMSVETYGERIMPTLEQCGLSKFASVLTQVCIRYLGLTVKCAAWFKCEDERIAATMMEEILRAGNINNQNNTDDISNFFVERSGAKSSLVVFVSKLNAIAKRRYRIAQRFPLTLPVFWIYIPFKYWIRSLGGMRKRKSLLKTVEQTRFRKNLYRELRLYETSVK